MKDKNMIVRTIELIAIIILYHITNDSSIFLYTLTLSLYNVFISCFSHITLKDTYKNNNNDYSKLKILKYTTINITIIYLIFILLSIFIGDTISSSLNIKNTFLPYLFMSLSIITEPLIKILLEYLESYNKPKLSKNLLSIYYIIEYVLLVLISIVTFIILKLPANISVATLYLSKILSLIIISISIYIIMKKMNIKFTKQKLNYKKELKLILTNNSHKSIINIIRNSYYYISTILLYLVLSNRYSYDLELIEKNLTFIYLYGIYIMNYIINGMTILVTKKESIINYIYTMFKNILITAIFIGITSPLICKILFLTNQNSIYLMMISFMSIFITLYNITFDYIKNIKVIYISLILGLISKLILTIPLINSFYRMGYNLVYGDIISTIISISISVIINYIYIKLNNKKEKTIEKILKTLYDSILLCIILVVLQFIVPVRTDSYIKALFTLLLYLTISIMYIGFKKKKRG